ncbi:MAG: HEAT repeat domain-containing protein [Bradymonadaceae bacterium]
MAYSTRKWRRSGGRLGLLSAVLVAFGLAMLQATPASAETGSVRYSYEKVEIGPRVQWALVPHPEEALRGEVDVGTVEKAFDLLRSDKETSYGETSIEVTREGDKLTAKVQIDPDYAKYQVIIKSEVVYTLTELGVDEVRFPGFAEGPVTRADIPMSAYTATVPLWRSLPPGEFRRARVRLPTGKLVSTAEVYRRWRQGDAELKRQLFTYLEADGAYTVTSVLDRLAKLEVDYAEEVLPLLERDERTIRSAALDALKNQLDRTRVRDALVEFVRNESDAKLARRAAEMLGSVDDETYRVHRWFYLLDNGSEKEKKRAAVELKKFKGIEGVVDRLDRALRSEKAAVAKAAEQSLVALQALDELKAALKADGVSSSLKSTIADALTKQSSDAAKIAGYRYLAANAEGRRALTALDALAAIQSAEARRALESFLTAGQRRLRRRAVDLVEQRGEMASLPALAKAATSVDDRRVMEQAILAILSGESVSTILSKTESSNPVIQRVAYRALGEKAREGETSEKVLKALREAAKSSDPAIRGAAARGLGRFANEKALAVLRTLADDSSPEVRRGVARALSNYEPGTLTDRLVEYLGDDSPKVVAGALFALAQRGEKKKWARIKSLVSADDPLVRKRAIEAVSELVSRTDKQKVRQAISLLSGRITSENDPSVLRTALHELGTFSNERAVNGIAIMLNAKKKNLRLAALDALGDTGHASAVDLVRDVLSQSDPEVRRAAIEALGDIGNAAAKTVLQQQLKKAKNDELKRLIQTTLDEL